MKWKVGYIIEENFNNADVVNTQAVLPISKSTFNYISSKRGFIKGASQYEINADETYDSIAELDVLIIPSLGKNNNKKEVIEFIKKIAPTCKYVFAIGDGLISLGLSETFKGRRVTSSHKHKTQLIELGFIFEEHDSFHVDGNLITAATGTASIEGAYKYLSLRRGKFITKMLELNLEYNPTNKFKHINQKTLPEIDYKPLKIAIVTPPKLYLPDVAGAIEVFSKLPNTEIHFLWKDKGKRCSMGPNNGPSVKSYNTFKDLPKPDIIVVGAIKPKDTVDQELLDYLKANKNATALIGICAGSFAFGSAGMLQNKKSLTNLHMLHLLKKVGGKRQSGETTRDGNLFTGGPAVGSYEVAFDVINDLYGEEVAGYFANEIIEYKPRPLFDKGSPEKAGHFKTFLSKALSRPLVWAAYNRKIKKAFKANK